MRQAGLGGMQWGWLGEPGWGSRGNVDQSGVGYGRVGGMPAVGLRCSRVEQSVAG